MSYLVRVRAILELQSIHIEAELFGEPNAIFTVVN